VLTGEVVGQSRARQSGCCCNISGRAVRKGSDVLSEILAEDSRETRINLSAAARRAAETLAKMPGSKVIEHAQVHRAITASSSQLHGWGASGKRAGH
jgi:hypothetical protein